MYEINFINITHNIIYCFLHLIFLFSSKVNSDWDIAVNGISSNSGNWNEWMVGIAAKYAVDEESILRLKINSAMQLGTSLQQKLNENTMISLSFCFDCMNINRGNHKVGLALDVEAWEDDNVIEYFEIWFYYHGHSLSRHQFFFYTSPSNFRIFVSFFWRVIRTYCL